MIQFSCTCGQKFRIKPEFAGRKTSCPACKQPLVVPTFDHTQAIVPREQIDGTPSSIAQVGLEGGVTLAHEADQKPITELLARQSKKGQRYLIEGEIARGGMGAVLCAVDCDIRREVAVKYLLDQSDARKKLRFIEEAQITGQLEHPNIVPIHELGADREKRLFFSMKMVKGRSLAQILDELRNDPKTAEKEHSLGRLLNILVNVCNGLAYAHSRGVVHRDLKPPNIMVGDFGEVYVMDWGLAKVLKVATVAEGMIPPDLSLSAAPEPLSSSSSSSTKRLSKVVTSREPEADLTQDGAIVGTPVYMPPEQATGRMADIDQRSDVYSLGAILYEMLTLQPPVDRDGGYLTVLMRVAAGEIVPPEQRHPGRVGRISRDLTAIAMKALAKKPEDRYPNVEALRKDIERFQEGRSVSARHDSFKEMAWKLVKRNKLASAFTTVLTVVLLWGSLSNWLARRDAERANARTTERTEKAVPALVRSARLLGAEGKFPEALEQVDFALDYDAKYAEAKLLRGQLFIAQKNFKAGSGELEQYLRERPQDAEAKKLLGLCAEGRTDDPAVLFAVAQVFQQQKASGLAVNLFKDVDLAVKSRQQLLKVYQQQIEEAWPGMRNAMTLDENGQFRLNLSHQKKVASLDRLKGMQINVLDLFECDRIADLTPLQGMPLTELHIDNCPLVRDLSPLQGMRLTSLSMMNCVLVKDLSPLKGMRLTSLSMGNCVLVSDLSPLQGMPLTTLYLHSCRQVHDLTPLQGMPLTTLHMGICPQVHDLTPLKGMPLTSLVLFACGQVNDLTPLKGMPLTSLNLSSCGQVSDLRPLKEMPLTTLNLDRCNQVRDLTPLSGMKLTDLGLFPRSVTTGMDGIRQMKSLKSISVDSIPYTPDDFWQKYENGGFK